MKSRWLSYAAALLLVSNCAPPAEMVADRPNPTGDNGRDVPTMDIPTDVPDRDMPTRDVRIARDIPDLDVPEFDAMDVPNAVDTPTADMPTGDTFLADRPDVDVVSADAVDVPDVRDTGPVDVVERDARVPAGSQPAGAECIGNVDCRMGLVCATDVRNGFCTRVRPDACMNQPGMVAAEEVQCVGAGSTCLALGDGPTQNTLCTQQCVPGPGSGCRDNMVCTGWWYTHAGAMPDAPGCWPFCHNDGECPAGEVCNTRIGIGACGMERFDPMALADGQPCTQPAAGDPSPCRGLCFGVQNAPRGTGICGSFLDLGVSGVCPEGPSIRPLQQRGDNLSLCIFRECGMGLGCCPAGLTCEPGRAAGVGACTYSDGMAGNNVACGM